jgi:hypothetical protein
MEPTIQERLRQQDQAFDQAPVAGVKNSVPDDLYQAVVNRFDYIDTAKGLKLKTEMTIAVGQYTGSELECWHDLEDPEKFKYLKQHLQALDVPEPASLAELDDSLKQALDCPVAVNVVERNGYKNAYVRQRLGAPLKADTVTPSADYQPTLATPTDDIPF